jgi:hypothetical protein
MEPKPSPSDTNTSRTTESESQASENPVPGSMPEAIIEKPAAKTREDARKERHGKPVSGPTGSSGD